MTSITIDLLLIIEEITIYQSVGPGPRQDEGIIFISSGFNNLIARNEQNTYNFFVIIYIIGSNFH